MLKIENDTKFFICNEPVNMNNSFDGLKRMIHESFPERLTDGYFVFFNNLRDKVKVMYWDGDGFVLWYKKLEVGFFVNLSNSDKQISHDQFIKALKSITSEKQCLTSK